MGVGTLVPCFKQVALPGDTFDIQIDAKVLTHPTIGPLFGSYKMQIDFFTCPMRLYMAPLHNNALNVGLDMSKVKMPVISINKKANETKGFSKSSILSYLGWRGIDYNTSTIATRNALPLLSYLDIFKNYYANKQEELFYALTTGGTIYNMDFSQVAWKNGGGTILTMAYGSMNYQYKPNYKYAIKNGAKTISEEEVNEYFEITGETSGLTIRLKNGKEYDWGTKDTKFQLILNGKGSIPSSFDLSELDKLREGLLKQGYSQSIISDTTSYGCEYLAKILGKNQDEMLQVQNANSGLLLKTLQSDIFNNWVKTEVLQLLRIV